MGIKVKAKTEAKASIKLYNAIASYRFEQQYDEMKGNTELEKALDKVQTELSKIIKRYRNG